MIINDYVTDLCVYCTIFLIAILECTLSTYEKNICCETVCHVMLAEASCIS